MDKKESPVKETKIKTERVKIIFSVIILAILFLADLFLMINTPENFIALVVTSVVLLADVYVLVVALMQESYHRDTYRNEQYENIFKSEKASYLLLRKSFEEIQEKLEDIEEGAGVPTEEIIAAEKAIAKVTISRSKENTDAMMNSNDKLLEKFFEFEDKLDNSNTIVIDSQKIVTEQANKEIIMKQQEIIAGLKEMELSIKNEMLQSINKIATSQPQVVMAPAMPQMQTPPISTPVAATPIQEPVMESVMEESSAADDEDVLAMDESIAKTLAMQEKDSEPEMEEIEEEVTQEPEVEVEPEKAAMPDLSDPNKPMTPDEIAALLANADALTASEPESEPEPEPEIEPEVEPEPEPEPVIAPVELEEEKPAMPDLSDPNKPMTPDEIAALLANADALTTSEPEPEPVEEEKPPMPDLSDPNKTLSADEIAALFANM